MSKFLHSKTKNSKLYIVGCLKEAVFATHHLFVTPAAAPALIAMLISRHPMETLLGPPQFSNSIVYSEIISELNLQEVWVF